MATASALLAIGLPGAMADGPYVSVSESATWQDNVTYAPSGDGIRSAFSLGSGADISWLHSMDFSTVLTTGLSANAEVCTTFSGLDSLSIGPNLELSHKIGVGPYAAVLKAGLQGSATGFIDPERSNIEGDLVLGMAQRLSDALQVVLDARLGSYDARDIVFCGNFASLDSALNWDVTDTWRIKVLGGWRTGDTVADYSAERTPSGWAAIDPETENLPGAWHYVSTFGNPFVAYRVSARTWSYGAAISPAIGRHSSLRFQFVQYVTSGYDRYVDSIASLSLEHHF